MDESKEACPACAVSGEGITDDQSFFLAYEAYLSTLASVNTKLKEQFITKIWQFGEHMRSRCPEFSFAKLANVHLCLRTKFCTCLRVRTGLSSISPRTQGRSQWLRRLT